MSSASNPSPQQPAKGEAEQTAQRFAERFANRIGELRSALQGIEPYRLAHSCGARFESLEGGQGQFHLELWGRPMVVSYPGFLPRIIKDGKDASPMEQALLLYYLNTADGAPLTGRWISFADLPDGRFYNQAFQGYTGNELARAFQDDLADFERVARSFGGVPHTLGDAAFAFRALPCVPLLVVYWMGDEDFASTCQVLFDDSASHYLPTDAYAILGSALTRRLIAARRNSDAIRH